MEFWSFNNILSSQVLICPNFDCRLIWSVQMAAIQLVFSVTVDSLCKSLLSGTSLHETLPYLHLFLLGFYMPS